MSSLPCGFVPSVRVKFTLFLVQTERKTIGKNGLRIVLFNISAIFVPILLLKKIFYIKKFFLTLYIVKIIEQSKKIIKIITILSGFFCVPLLKKWRKSKNKQIPYFRGFARSAKGHISAELRGTAPKTSLYPR